MGSCGIRINQGWSIMVGVTDEYKAQLQAYHVNNPSWGTGAHAYKDTIFGILRKLGGASILDYGCGKGTLKKSLEGRAACEVYEYDPGIPGKDTIGYPKYDLVVSRDVLEHVEPEMIDEVLQEIADKARLGVWLMIHTKPAGAVLPDGRNAHLIQEGLKWWKAKLDVCMPGHSIEWKGNTWLIVNWKRENAYG